MGCVTRESPQSIERILQPRERAIECRGEPAEFIIRIVHRKALRQPISRDCLRFRSHRCDRRQCPTCHEISAGYGQRQGERETGQKRGREAAQTVLYQAPRKRDRYQDDRRPLAILAFLGMDGHQAALQIVSALAGRFPRPCGVMLAGVPICRIEPCHLPASGNKYCAFAMLYLEEHNPGLALDLGHILGVMS